MLAMTYMYAGERDFGLELARRCVHSLNIRNLLTWNQPNILRADNGDMLFGSHYVQNMMLWAVPAAFAVTLVVVGVDYGHATHRSILVVIGDLSARHRQQQRRPSGGPVQVSARPLA